MHRNKIVVLGALLASLWNGRAVLLADPVGVFDDAVDVGGPPVDGSTIFDGVQYTLQGAGADIGDGGDQFHFAYKRLSGDFTATIRISSRSTTPAGSGTLGRYGLMVRWSVEANAKYSMIANVLPTEDAPFGAFPSFYQFRMFDRQDDGNRVNYSASDDTFPTEGRSPSWMRIVRRGTAIYGYLSEDAEHDMTPDRWILIGSDSAAYLPDVLLVGVALCSQADDTLGTIVFDSAAIETPPVEAPLLCTAGDPIVQLDFENGFGVPSSEVRVAAPISPYSPRVTGGRLRLTQDGVPSTGTAVWYDLPGSESLAATGFVAEFDLYMTKPGLFDAINPADGMTFAVVDGGAEILGDCPDRTEPRVQRFSNTTLVSRGLGCAPATITSVVRDLIPTQTSTNAVRSEGDIWADGDTFLYQYQQVSGDFDIPIEMTSYAHATGQGDWGKFGLMARQTLDTRSRYTMMQSIGPGAGYPARQSMRTVHLSEGDTSEFVLPNVGARPRFQRLTRRGNVFQGWASDNPGLGDGSLNPSNDCNWIPGTPDEWGDDAPPSVLVGFANSNHASAGCATQTIQYRGLPASAAKATTPSDLIGGGGGYLGYGGGTLRKRTTGHPNFAVEIDTWTSAGQGEPGNDPPGFGSPNFDGRRHHFGLDVNAEVSSIQTSADYGVPFEVMPNFLVPFNPPGAHVTVSYAPDGQVDVFSRSNASPSNGYQMLSARIPALTGKLLFGFTAGTGDATATFEVDNFVLRSQTCAPQPTSTLAADIIDLSNVTGGGDGSHGSPSPHVGVDPRTGAFVDSYFNGRLNDTDLIPLAPQSPSPYIDSVFYLSSGSGVGGDQKVPAITQSGVTYAVSANEATGSTWNYILKDRNGGVATPGITLGPLTGFTTSVGIHAAAGITYNLDALRERHGAQNVQCFSTTWGLDNCATGDITLHAIVSDDAGSIASRSFRATAGSWDILRMPIPNRAKYLTLATGANGNDNCDHGTFARPVITSMPCPSYSSFSWIWSVLPSLVSTEGGSDVAFFGEFLSDGDTLRVGGVDLTNLAYVSEYFYAGRMPALPPGFYDAQVFNSDGGVSASLPRAIEVAPPLQLLAVEPRDVFLDVETPVVVRGANFRSQTRVSVVIYPGGDPFPLIDPVFVSETEIQGRVPVLPPGEPSGFREVLVVDGRGSVSLPEGVQYVDLSSVQLTSVSPSVVSTLGGTRVSFVGAGFAEGLVTPYLGGLPLSDVVFLSENELEGTSPELPAGFHDADLIRPAGDIVATLPSAVEARTLDPNDVQLVSVTPAQVSTLGGDRVTFSGAGFVEGLMIPRIAGELLLDVTFLSDTELQGSTPPLAAGLQDADLQSPSGEVLVTLPGAVEVILPASSVITSVAPSSIPEGQGAEVVFEGEGFHQGLTPRLSGVPLLGATFVDASHFQGFAPELALGFHDADLADSNGAVVAVLAGAVEVVPAQAGSDLAAPAEIDAVYAEGKARFVWSNPLAYDKIVATEILSSGGIGRVFQLDGNSTSLLVSATRVGVALELKGFWRDRISVGSLSYAYPAECGQPTPLGGYGIVGKLDFPLFGGNLPRLPVRCAPAPRAPVGGGGGAFDLFSEWASINGFTQVGEGYGVTARDRTLYAILATYGPHRYSNRLVTGFTLETDADRLQIEGFYQKIGEAPELALMGRLVHIFPDDGFEDEFTLPDAAPGEDPDWHGLTYFRANKDVAEADAQTCNLKIPKGDYILQLYAINGEPDQSYYLFRDDGRDVELLVPGAPCPPYPLVRIRDVSGKRTLPNISDIKAREVAPLQVEFRATGGWFDGVSPFPHSIDPADASYVAHNFEFFWTIESSAVAGTKSSGNSNRIVVPVKAIGCYRVHLTIRDRACDRAVTTTREAIVTPTKFLCTVSPYVVQNPTPDPSGIIAIAGLDPGPGQGRMTKRRELSLRVLISSESLCGGDARVVAPDVGDLQFQLVWSYLNGAVFPPLAATQMAVPSGEIVVTNLCRSVRGSPYTYFELLIRELGRARPLPIWADNGALVPVKLQWRTLWKEVRTAQGGVIRLEVKNDPWHDVSPSLRMTNAPLSLGKNNWQGSFSPLDQTYRFIHQSSDHYQSEFDLGRTPSVPVGIIPGVSIPPMDNNYGAGLNTEVALVNGIWVAGKAKVDEGGEILSNKIRGGTLQIESSKGGRGGALEDGAIKEALRSQTTYSWCKQQEIFNKTHEQELFNAVIFAGAIGPVPVVVWASVGLALKVAITAQAGVVVSLFDAIEGKTFVKSDVFFKSELGLHIPASIHADVLFGVVSVVFKLIPQVNAVFGVHVGNKDLELIKEANLSVFLKLSIQLKLCFLSFLNDLLGDALCIGTPQKELINKQLIDVGDPIVYEDCPEGSGGGNAADGRGDLPPAAGGGAGSDIVIELEEFLPATKASRDGTVAIDVAYEKSDTIYAPRTRISVKIGDGPRKLFATRLFWELDPSIGFLSKKRALIAWTRSFAQDAIDAGATVHPDNNYTNDELNFFRAHDEIIITPASETAPNFWDVEPDFIISDPRAEVPDPAARRVDGRPSVAGDETHGDALVAWVRIDDPEYYYLDPATNQTRIHLEKASIFARAVGFSGVLDVPQQVSTGGINIEPSVTFSPSGNVAYCVWVNDPNHVDLLGSNRGRNLVVSVYQRSTNLWSVPQPIFADPDSYPGMLEPTIALKGDDYGLLAFTALDASADEKDTGLLDANRYVYISRLVDGVFGPPMRVHGKCEKRVFGSKVVIEIPKQAQDPLERVLKKWEWQVFYQSAGPVMSVESAGGLMTSGLPEGAFDPTPAVAVLADGNIRSNMAATMTTTGIQVVSLSLGPSLRRVAAGVGGGAGIEPLPQGVFETTEIRVLPDLSIASCALSNQFPGPGARVTLNVKIENDGLIGSAANSVGQSLVGLEVHYIDDTGAPRLVATSEVPVIEAGTSTEVTLVLEQPLDPVRLLVALHPNPIDSNPLNDSVERFFGTPAPVGFVCESIPLGENEPLPGMQLTWSSPVPYEEIFIYRDGGMLAAIPGGSTTYVDREPGPGSHTYEIRARVEVSKSSRVLCGAPPPPPSIFRRGDADANGQIQLTDAVRTLNFLFLGGRPPACFDAADADDSGTLAITDPIRTLNYLFLGGAAPPAPGPNVCGEDPTNDSLTCESESPGC